jgi:hypothetical protein
MRTVMVRDSTVTVWVPAAIAGRLPQAQLSNPITTARRTILRSLFMHETLHVSSHGCLERIGQSALRLGDEFARRYTAHAPDFAAHVRLVCVACARGHVGQVMVFGSRRKPEEPLEAEHAVQRLESVAEGIHAPPAQGALAQAHMRRQLIEPVSRGHAVVACGPSQERDLRVGKPDGGQSADEKGFEVLGQLFRTETCCGSIEEACRIVPPELGKRYSNIHDLTQRLAQPRRGRPGMEAHSYNDRTARHASENGPGVGAGDAEGFAGPDDIDAAVGHNLQTFGARSREIVDPQAADVPAQRRVRRPLAVDATEL